MTIDAETVKIIKESKTIAVVGASRNPDKAANEIPKYLKEQGFKIIPINPKANEILGEKAYPDFQSVPEPIDIVDIFRPSEETPAIVRVAVKVKPKLIWLQLGISNDEAEQIAEDYRIKFVMNHCLKEEHERLTGK